nr:hypothetical protein [bacterium]
VSGSTQTGNLTARTRYLCSASSATTIPTSVNTILDIQVGAPLPLDASMSATTPVTVGENTTLTWTSTNASSCQVYEEQGLNSGNWVAIPGANTLSGTQSDGPFTTAGSYRYMTQCVGTNTTPGQVNQVFTVAASNPPTPEPPANPPTSSAGSPVVTNQQSCGTITVSWGRASGGTDPEFFRVYRRTSPFDAWQQFGSDVAYSGNVNTTYSVTDTAPLSTTGSNYYTVSAYRGTAESAKSSGTPSPIVPVACAANISTSDIDLIQVNGNNTSGATQAQACSGNSELYQLPNNGVFKNNDTVKFKMNICNTGNQTLTNVSIADTLINLSGPGNYTFSPIGCSATPSVNGSTITFAIASMAPNTVCSITFTAVVTPPSTSTGSLFRFQSSAVITSSQLAGVRISTPPYMFGSGSSAPVRVEK